MSVLYLVMGKSASGKDTIFQRLKEDATLNLKTIVPYTTRPKREGEAEGREYYFVSEEQFLEMKKEHKIMESRTYQTVHGDWTYFTADDGQINMNREVHYLLIGTLETYVTIREYYRKKIVGKQGKEEAVVLKKEKTSLFSGKGIEAEKIEGKKEIEEWLKHHIKPVYIEVEDGERLLRALQRESCQEKPRYAELCRRFLADEEDFSEENLRKAGIRERFQNKELEICLEQIRSYLE